MKKSGIRIFAMCFVALLLFSVPAGAVARSSDYISDYTINIFKSGEKIKIGFEITGTGKMSKLGASEIEVYEEPYTSEDIVYSKSESDSGMVASNARIHSNSFTYSASSGKMYKVVVTVFAQNSSGSDSRTETRYLSF